MKIITRMLEDELYVAANAFGNKVSMDMLKNPVKQGQSPVELLLSSLATCAAIDIVIMLKKIIEAFTIETEGPPKVDTPMAITNIHCKFSFASPDATETELNRTARLSLEKYCSVAASLSSSITFSAEIIRPR